jgi:hypothetical protein
MVTVAVALKLKSISVDKKCAAKIAGFSSGIRAF